MKRWFRRILFALLILIGLALIVTQIVLWTDYPRRIVLSLVQRELGLRVEAESMSTGWLGNTTLHDVKLSLPLGEESFVDVPELQVEHTALIPLAVTRKFELDAVELHRPNLIVRRDQHGRWDLQDVIELVSKTLGGNPEPAGRQRAPRLPRVHLMGGTVRLIEHDGRRTVIEPLEVSGYADGPLVYRYDATVPDRLKLVGEVAPGESWKHVFRLNAQPGEWLTPWLDRIPEPLSLDAEWSGVVNNGAVTGRLIIEQGRVDHYTAHGRVAAQFENGSAILLRPQDLTVTTEHPIAPSVRIASGALQVSGMKLRLDQLRVETLGGLARIDGEADVAARSGDIRGVWLNLTEPAPPTTNIRHNGNLQFSLRTPFPGRPVVTGAITTRGNTPRGVWEGEVSINGAGVGRGPDEMDWQISLARASWDGRTDYALQNLAARLTQRGPILRLGEVTWPGHRVTAAGEMNLQTRRWSFGFDGTDTIKTTFDFRARAHGDAHLYMLDELSVRAHEAELKAHGTYDGRRPAPVELTVLLTHLPETLLHHVDEEGISTPFVRGRVVAEAQLAGTSKPLKLDVTGSLRAQDLVALDRDIGNIAGQFTGNITSEFADLNIDRLDVFGGRWTMRGVWPYHGTDKLINDEDPIRLALGVEQLQLSEVGDLLKIDDASGAANGRWIIDLPLAALRRDRIAAKGELRTGPVAVGPVEVSTSAPALGSQGGPATAGVVSHAAIDAGPISADEIIATMTLRNGVFHAHPIILRKSTPDAEGSATAAVQFTLQHPTRPNVTLKSEAWPIALSTMGVAAIWTDARLNVDAGPRRPLKVTGPVALTAKFATRAAATQPATVATSQPATSPQVGNGHPLGELVMNGRLEGRRATIESITLNGLGGSAAGHAALDADAPNQTNAILTWTDVDSARLADLLPQLAGISGIFSGSLAISPADSSRAIEPLRLTLGFDPSGEARFRSVNLGPARLSAFMSLDTRFMPSRLVLDETVEEIARRAARERELDRQGVEPAQRPLAWNDIRLGDGRILLWARQSTPGRAQGFPQVQTHLIAEIQRLDIDQIVHAVMPDEDPMPGRLTGRVTLHGDPRDPELLLGEGNLSITESDLAEVDALKVLYSLLSGTSTRGNRGEGKVDFSLQSGTLTLNNIYYFNRGIEAWSNNVTIDRVLELPDSPVSGYVVGSARPLSALKLPFLADVDQIMSVLQSNLTTVKVEGTVEDYSATPATFSDVGEGLKRFLRGQVTSSQD